MNIADKLDSVACKQDHQARRVLNVSPDVAANISADELEKGVTLERLEALNIPVFRYSTQVTIHGHLPDFNNSARPGGYKALFLNANGSAGVRYAAIDAEKKSLIQRACSVAGGKWHANLNSQGLEVFRTFIVETENVREAVRNEAREALLSIPKDLFFGNAFSCSLAYGAGYGVGVYVGAIYDADLWKLAEFFTGLTTVAEIEEREQKKESERDAYFAQLRASNEAAAAVRAAELKGKLEALRPQLTVLTDAPDQGAVFVETSSGFLTVRMEKAKGRLFYTILERNFEHDYGTRKLAKDGFPWAKALAAGRVYGMAA